MSTLARCIEISNIHPLEAERLIEIASEYRKEGFEAQKANENAVKDVIKELNKERDSIIGQIKSQILAKKAKATKLEKRLGITDIGKIGDFDIPKLANAFLPIIKAGEKLNKLGVQAKVAEMLGIAKKALISDKKYSHKQIEEAFEYAIVMRAREIISESKTVNDAYTALKKMYDAQPLLSTRTSTSIKQQMYSTPVHLAYLAQVMAGANAKPWNTVYEPSGGTGMLLTVPNAGSVTVNEIDGGRVGILKDQGFDTKQGDGTTAVDSGRIPQRSFGSVLANPPFGSIAPIKVDGYDISKIEHQMVTDALKAMRDNGSAAFIIGGQNFDKGKMNTTQKVFLNWLYNKYYVKYNIGIPGKEYSRQGATFPIRLIVVDGRKKIERGAAPIKETDYQSIKSIDELLTRGFIDGSMDAQRFGKTPVSEEALRGISPEGIEDVTGELPALPRDEDVEPDKGVKKPGRRHSAAPGRPSAEGVPEGRPPGEPTGPRPSRPDEPGPSRLPTVPGAVPPRGAIAPITKEGVEPGGRIPSEPGRIPEGVEGVELQGIPGTDAFIEGLLGLSAKEAKKAETREKKAAVKKKFEEGAKEVAAGVKKFNDIFGEEGWVGAKEPISDKDPQWLRAKEALREIWAGLKKMAESVKARAEMFVKEVYAVLSSRGKPYVDKFIMDVIKPEIVAEAETLAKPKKPIEPTKPLEEGYQVPYTPKSKGPVVDETLIPRNMRDAVMGALDNLEKKVGDIDDYVKDKLGYKDQDALFKALSSDQVDAVALAIFNMDHGIGMIIGDQTGVGKGRVAAAIMDYAKIKGNKPIFFTEKANLFTDLYRDVVDIGRNMDPFIMASNPKLGAILDKEEKVVYPVPNPKERSAGLKRLRAKGVMGLDDKDSVVATYSQVNKPNMVRNAITELSKGNVLVLDESHNASGESSTGKFLRDVLTSAESVLYMSATFAKRPSTMPLYFRTALGDSNLPMEELVNAIKAGGLPLQEIVSSNLAEMGQCIRREKSFKGIAITSNFSTKTKKQDTERSNGIAASLRNIVSFDKKINGYVKGITKELAKGREVNLPGVNIPGATVVSGQTVRSSVTTSNFASVVHNAIRQSLLCMKTDMAIDFAIEELKAGRKPIIALANTMGSFVQDQVDSGLLKEGDAFNLTMRDIMDRHLRRVLQIKVTSPQGEATRQEIPTTTLPREAQEAHKKLWAEIETMHGGDINGNPIDHIRKRLMEAGYSVDELTGRKHIADLADLKNPALAVRSAKSKAERNAIVSRFNNGTLDCLIINAAGATGLSLHSSPEFKDQRPRTYIGLQAEQNVDTEIQKMGRINRKGQTTLPSYQMMFLDLPTEIRPAAVLNKKLKSLSANTTAGADSPMAQKTLPDMLNKYGDEVTKDWLVRNAGHAVAMGVKPGDDMHKVTGRLALQSVRIQDQFYEDVEQEYISLIETLKEEGRYDLEVGEIDFKAETREKVVLTQGTDEKSPFSASTYREQLRVAMPTKPYNKKRIEKIINERLGGKTPEEVMAEYIAKVATKRDEYLAKKSKDLTKKEHAELTAQVHDSYEDLRDRLSHRKEVGTKASLNSEALGEQVGAVIIDIRLSAGEGNPTTLSRTKIVYALNNALQKTMVPLSQINARGASAVDQWDVPDSMWENWDESLRADVTQLRYMITGNLLQGYADASAGSRIVRYTTKSGETKEGILLPLIFTPSEVIDEVRITADQVTAAIEASADVFIDSEKTSIHRVGRDNYFLKVPRTKVQGAVFFLDEKLLSLVTDEFESRAGRMEAMITKKNLLPVVERLYELGEVFKIDRTAFNTAFNNKGGGVGEKIEHYSVSEAKVKAPTKEAVDVDIADLFPTAISTKPTKPAVRMGTTGYIAADGNIVRNPKDAAALLAPIRKHAQELLYGITTDKDGVVLEIHQYSKGTGAASQLKTVELMGNVMAMPEAATYYFVHNHPSGMTEVSGEDIIISNQIENLLSLKNINTQSLVIAGTHYAEFDASGDVYRGAKDIRPTVRKTKLPVKERLKRGGFVPLEHKPVRHSKDVSDVLNGFYNNADGFLLMDVKNKVVDFVDYPVGKSGAEGTAILMSRIASSGADRIVFNSSSMKISKSDRNLFLKHFFKVAGDSVALLDILDQGVSLADTGSLKRVVPPKEPYIGDAEREMRDYSDSVANLKRQGPLFLKRDTATSKGVFAAAELQKEVNKTTARWENAPKVKVVQHQSDLPVSILAHVGKGNIVDGVYFQGTVHIVADNQASIETTMLALIHESFGHYGLRGVLGKEFGQIMQEVYIAKKSAIDKVAKEYGADVGTFTGRALASEEWLAREAAGNPSSGWVRRVIAAIKKFIRSIIPSLAVTDTMVYDLLDAARGYVERGTPRLSDGLGAHFNLPGYVKEKPAFAKRKEPVEAIDITGFLPSAVEKQMEAAKGVPKATFKEKAVEKLVEMKAQKAHFPDLQTIEDKNLRAMSEDILRRHQEIHETAKNKTLRLIDSFTKGLSKDGYKVYRLNIFLADMMRDIRNGLTYDGKLPFGFKTTEEVSEAYDKFQKVAEQNPEIAKALKARKDAVNDIKKRLVKDNLLKKEVLKEDDYFHHQIIKYWQTKYKMAGASQDVRTHWRPWMAARKGSILNYNTDYIEAEYTAISEQLVQLETVETLRRLKKEADVYAQLKGKAKAENSKNLWALLREQGRIKKHPKTGKEVDPLLPWKQKIAMSNMGLAKMASNGDIEYDSEWQGLIDELARSYDRWKELKGKTPDQPHIGVNDKRWFDFLSYLVNTKKPGANWAATILKAIKERDAFIEDTLGDKFLTYKDLFPEKYVEWKADPNKGWFWANVITDKILERMQKGEIDPNDVESRKLLAKGSDLIWVIPEGLAKTLDNFRGQPEAAFVGQVADRAMRAWKQYILLNPYSVVRYNLNNASGDLDACLAYAPEIVTKYAWKAFWDLRKWHKRQTLDKKIQEEIDYTQSSGAIQSGFSMQEVDDVYTALKTDKDVRSILADEQPNWFAKSEWFGLKRAGPAYWGFVRRVTALRENTLRLAAYRFFMNNQDKRLYGASDPVKIDAITNPREKSSKLSRELFGDYGAISKSGEYIRKRLMPFYSWMEINAPRYVYLMRNTKYENRDVDSVKKQMVAVAGKKLVLSATKMALRASMLMGAVMLWNLTMFPDEEEELGESGRRQMHIILGRREDGSIITLRFQGALSDALSFFGLEDWPADMKDLLEGKRTVGEKLKEVPLALLNRGVQAIRPEPKMLGEMISGKAFYPDVTRPLPIRDKIEHLLRTFKLDRIYREALERPGRGKTEGASKLQQVAEHFIDDLKSLLVYESDPGLMAYYDARKMAFDWLAKTGDEKRFGGRPTKKGNAFYYYKQALKYGDPDAAQRYLKKYYELGGTRKGRILSIKYAHPLSSIPKMKRNMFRASLDAKQQERFVLALQWYSRTYGK